MHTPHITRHSLFETLFRVILNDTERMYVRGISYLIPKTTNPFYLFFLPSSPSWRSLYTLRTVFSSALVPGQVLYPISTGASLAFFVFILMAHACCSDNSMNIDLEWGCSTVCAKKMEGSYRMGGDGETRVTTAFVQKGAGDNPQTSRAGM